MSSKNFWSVSVTRQQQSLQWRRSPAVEEILRKELNAAQFELDQIVQARTPVPETLERYLQAVQRMRKFLTVGEIPVDVSRTLGNIPPVLSGSIRTEHQVG